MFADDSDVGAFLFVRQEEPAADWAHSQEIKIIGGYDSAVQLHRRAHAGQDEAHPTIRGQTCEDILCVSIMPEPRNRSGQLLHIALLRLAVDADELIRFREGEPGRKDCRSG